MIALKMFAVHPLAVKLFCVRQGIFGKAEDLARQNTVRVGDLVLVGDVDGRVADAGAVDTARDLPESIAAADNDRLIARSKRRLLDRRRLALTARDFVRNGCTRCL